MKLLELVAALVARLRRRPEPVRRDAALEEWTAARAAADDRAGMRRAFRPRRTWLNWR